jgi:glycosyltransferase involved in cell wall biosynthesis
VVANTPRKDELRLAWAYDREHLRHPFIVLAMNSLAAAGVEATIISSDTAPAGAAYASENDFNFAARARHWEMLAKQRSKKLRRQIDAAGAAGKRFQAALDRSELDATKALAALRRDTIDTWQPYVRGFRRLMRIDTDVIMASRPEAAMWAALAARLRGKPFVYFPFELYGDQLAKPHPLIAAAERLILQHAVDGLVTQNEMRARVYVEERRARVQPAIVHNFKPAQWRPRQGRLRAENPALKDKQIVLYEGQLVSGRWLDRLASAVLHLPDDIVLVMMGPEKAKWLKNAEEALRAPLASGRLIILPPAPQDDLPELVSDADLGVIIYDDTVRNNVFCEPGKLVDYIAVGVPVIAPNFPTIASLVQRYDLGVCFDGGSPEAIADAIKRALARPKGEWAPALERACGELTWETQFPVLLATIKEAAGVRETAPLAAPEVLAA